MAEPEVVSARQQELIAEARRLIKSGLVSILVAGPAIGAALAVDGPGNPAFILAAAIGVLAVLRTGQGLARLRRLRAYTHEASS